jgi:hypothetical protein
LKNILMPIAASSMMILGTAATAQQEPVVVLPLEAQTCDLPTAPPRIAVDADKEALLKAKKNVNDFQAAMVLYRGCLDKAKGLDTLTDGNRLALVEAHNYSVEMEERIAEQFNVAVRNYKQRMAAAKDQ